MKDNLITLGIETSCDETAASVIHGDVKRLSSVVATQFDLHAKYGGITPEIACRRHAEVIRPVIAEALLKADMTLDDVDLVAVTQGPGLVGALLVGLSYAKALAWGRSLPLVPVNHLKGHMAAAFVEAPEMRLPAIFLLVSGGHTELYYMKSFHSVESLGGTRDDAAGEAFDKVARLLGLGYPGGPLVEQEAKRGEARFKIPVAMKGDNLEFSFSGPKTAVRQLVEKEIREGRETPVADMCASFQEATIEALVRKTKIAVDRYSPASLAVVGGVACNGRLRERMAEMAGQLDIPLVIPSPHLCSDNAVMIASAGAKIFNGDQDNPKWKNYLTVDADPSLPVT